MDIRMRLIFAFFRFQIMSVMKIYIVNPPKADYGLFRATRSHNPPPFVLSWCFRTHVGARQHPIPPPQVSLRGGQAFGAVITIIGGKQDKLSLRLVHISRGLL
jgi:hypothetical protein